MVPKTEAAYKSAVVRLAGEMRKDGALPYGWVADNTRMRKPSSFDSAKDALTETARLYRRSLGAGPGAYVMVWCEKDAISGVLVEITDINRAGPQPLWILARHPVLRCTTFMIAAQLKANGTVEDTTRDGCGRPEADASCSGNLTVIGGLCDACHNKQKGGAG